MHTDLSRKCGLHMSRKVRIAQVITGLPLGGGGQVIWTISRKLDKARFDMDIFCVIEGGDLVFDIERMGFKVKIMAGTYDHKRFFPYSITKILRLSDELKKGQYDIVHTHLYQADVIGRVAAILAGIPRIVKSLHNMGMWKTTKHLIVDRLLLRRTAKVICCSNYQKEVVVKQESLPETKVETIYHGVDLERFKLLNDRHSYAKTVRLNAELLTIGTVGRMINSKGQIHFLNAIPAILSEHPHAQFVIIGDGPIRRHLFSAVENTPYREKIHFLGSRSDIPQLLTLMDVFVFPSLSEGLGISVLEAMASGLPVVASNIRPLSEMIIPENTGLLVKTEDPADLAGAVNRLLRDEDLRRDMGNRGRERVKQYFTDEQMVRQIENLYQALYEDSPLIEGLDNNKSCRTADVPIHQNQSPRHYSRGRS